MGLLVNMAIGDAFGAGFEYADASFVKQHGRRLHYQQHPSHHELMPGQYTDGVQMAIALAELLLDQSAMLSPLAWANALLRTFKNDPRVGYARGFYEFLKDTEDGEEFLRYILPHSDKSGAAERAIVCGMLGDEKTVIDRAMWQASLTHATQDGMAASAASALLVWACRHGLDIDELPLVLMEHLPNYPWDEPWTGPVTGKGISAVRAALTAIQSSTKLTEILKFAVELTGDVDGVCGIAMAAAGLHPSIENNLPKSLTRGLENGPTGRGYIEDLDARLEEAFPLTYEGAEEPDPKRNQEMLDIDPTLAEFFDLEDPRDDGQGDGWFLSAHEDDEGLQEDPSE